MSMAILGGGMKLNSKVNMTNILYIFFSKRHKSWKRTENQGFFFHENKWCLFCICVATMSPLTSDAVATYTYGASREACKAHGSTY